VFLFRGDVHQARDEIREPGGTLHALKRGDDFFRHLRQKLQDLDGAFAQVERPTLDVGIVLRRLLDVLNARYQERPALEKLQDAKALRAAADRVMRSVRRRDVAEHFRAGADPVQVVRTGLFDVGLVLQHDAQRALQAHGFLRRGGGARARDGQREHHAREEHDVAHRDDDKRVLGDRSRRGFRTRSSGLGRSRCRRGRVGGNRVDR